MRETITINLTDEQYNKAMEIGHTRHYNKHESFRERTTDLFNQTWSEEDKQNFLAHQIGILGELAYSIYTNQPIDETLYDKGDTGVDFINNKVEVKTSTYWGKDVDLKVTLEQWDIEPKPNLYVLARVNKKYPRRVELMGEISREEFDKVKVRRQYIQSVVNYVATLDKLKTVQKINQNEQNEELFDPADLTF